MTILIEHQKVILMELEDKAKELTIVMPTAANMTNLYVQRQINSIKSFEEEIQKLEYFNDSHLTHYNRAEQYLENVAMGLRKMRGRSFNHKTKEVEYDIKSLDWSQDLNNSWKINRMQILGFCDKNLIDMEQSKDKLIANINEAGEIEFDSVYIESILEGGYDNMSSVEQKHFIYSFNYLFGKKIVMKSVDSKESFQAIRVWWNELTSTVTNPITVGGTAADGAYAGVSVFVQHAKKIAKYREYINVNGTKMVAISDSTFYQGGRGGVRAISRAKLLRRTDNLGKAYRASNVIKTTGKVMIGISAAVSFYDEYQASQGLKTSERVTNATVEATWSVGSAVAIGAAVGSIVPGAGTVAGAAVGFIVGAVASVVVNSVVHAKWFDNGNKSAMDYMKDFTNDIVGKIGEQGSRLEDLVSEKFSSIGDVTANWLSFD